MTELLKSLQELMNHGLYVEALGLYRREATHATAAERDECRAILQQRTRYSEGVFFPLVDPMDPSRDRRVKVEVSLAQSGDDEVPSASRLDEATARKAVAKALDDAWTLLGGVEDRPRVRVSFPLLERVPSEARRIEGRSLYLAVFLAAVGAFGYRTPIRNVLATGDPEADLDLRRKRAERQDGLGIRELLAIGPGAGADGEGIPVTRCEDLRHAVAMTYRLTPILRFASAHCLHVYCKPEQRDSPMRFHNRTMLPDSPLFLGVLDESNFQASLNRVIGAIQPHQPTELSLATTGCFAAALGWSLANGVRPVWIVDVAEDVPWWSIRDRAMPISAERRPPVEAARVIVTCRPERARANWEPVKIPHQIHREDVSEIVGKVAQAVSGVARLSIAFDAPLALAFAVGTALRNAHEEITFWQFNGKDYVRVWSTPRSTV